MYIEKDSKFTILYKIGKVFIIIGQILGILAIVPFVLGFIVRNLIEKTSKKSKIIAAALAIVFVQQIGGVLWLIYAITFDEEKALKTIEEEAKALLERKNEYYKALEEADKKRKHKGEIVRQEFKDGTSKLGYAWTIKKPKANVIIITGMVETAHRYSDFAEFLCDHGYNVYCMDHYGQGLNAGEKEEGYLAKGIVPNSFFSKSVHDCDELVSKLRASLLPTFIFAHSMGSFMLQDYIQRYSLHVNKVVICGSNGPNAKAAYGFGYFVTKLLVHKKNALKEGKFFDKLIFGGYNKKIKHPRTSFDWLSVNTENVDKYMLDDLCGFVPCNKFYKEFLKGDKRLYKRKFLKKVRKDMSIFIIAGKDDPVGAYGKGPQKLAKMYKKLKIEDVRCKVYDNMRHEIMNEGDITVWNDVLAYLDEDKAPAERLLSK